MHVPSIPGFTAAPPESVAQAWSAPGAFPDSLWPVSELAALHRNPIGWLTVAEHSVEVSRTVERGCVLIEPGGVHDAMAEPSHWAGSDLGVVQVWNSGRFDDGVTAVEGEVRLRFFAQRRMAAGARQATIELDQSILWYFDAFPVDDGYAYLNRSGREQPLVRWQLAENEWTVAVRALEFRHYLSARALHALIQFDITLSADPVEFERVDAKFTDGWARGVFAAFKYAPMWGEEQSVGWVRGQYLLEGLANHRTPRSVERTARPDYPSFVYAVDGETGSPLRHSCDPATLGSFDEESRLHALTPVYFRREVLQLYAAEPARYRITVTSLRCLSLWSLDISFNSVGLVEVYLGDLGQALPPDDWGHWLSFNVPPEGEMEEGRFRRDFLNQPAPTRDVPGDLRRARERAATASQTALGDSAWRPLTGDLADEWESLVGPLSKDPAALTQPVLVMTKALIDTAEAAPMRARVGAGPDNEQSLALLKRLLVDLGGTFDVSEPLRHLQRFRSGGGVAHAAGRRRKQIAEDLGAELLDPVADFDAIATRLTAALNAVASVFSAAAAAESGPNIDASPHRAERIK